MRIALFTETFLPNVNGVANTLCRLLDYLQAHGHEAILFAPQGAPESYAGAEVVPLGGMPFPLYPEVNFTPPQFGITERLRQFRPDLLHLVSPVVFGVVGPTVARSLRLPILSSYHTDLAAYSHHYGLAFIKNALMSYLRWIHNRTRITLCPSRATLNDLRRQGFRRLKVWGRGVDTTRFHPSYRNESWRESIGVKPDENLLLYVGRLGREKRVDMLAESLRGLKQVRMVIVGDGPARADLEQRMRGLPVHFTGYLKGEDLSTAYASSDVFVFPSDTETFGQVVQEAMASGLPVVGARSGGTLDLVQEGVTGSLFEPGVASDLRFKLRAMTDNEAVRRSMGENGRAFAEQRSWPSVLGELMNHYTRMLPRKKRKYQVHPAT